VPGADHLAGRPASREADRNRFTYRAARADIGLGRWAEAESLPDSLPGGSAHGTLLRAELAFCRGDFAQAERARRDGAGPGDRDAARRVPVPAGGDRAVPWRFDDAREHGRVGIATARTDADQVRACRWTNLLAEIEYFSGNVDTAAALVRQALADAHRPGGDRAIPAPGMLATIGGLRTAAPVLATDWDPRWITGPCGLG
jgi:hypothetical protein